MCRKSGVISGSPSASASCQQEVARLVERPTHVAALRLQEWHAPRPHMSNEHDATAHGCSGYKSRGNARHQAGKSRGLSTDSRYISLS
eukprot:scaffold111278_cov34-Tisochrysis_lutea.AAC.2